MVEDGGLWQRQDGKQSNFGFGIYKEVFGMIGYIITAIIAFIAGTIFSCYFDVEIKDEEE